MAGGVVDCQIFRINGLAPWKSMKRYFVMTSNISTVLILQYYFYLLMLVCLVKCVGFFLYFLSVALI